ncbi:MAG TPA: YdaS family helix-turn-helix protein [Candidatus Saccharimonadia bacterium]|nr:YdaS family helix-turn-helix protein [Candidatus Saccharimonadia bacterium]
MVTKRRHAKRFIDLAIESGLSRNEIARHLGINRIQVHRWIHGLRPVPEHYCRLIVELFNQHFQCSRQRLQSEADLPLTKGQRCRTLQLLAIADAFIKELDELTEEHQLEKESLRAAHALKALKAMPMGDLDVAANAPAIAEWAETIMVYVNTLATRSALADSIKEVNSDADLIRKFA